MRRDDEIRLERRSSYVGFLLVAMVFAAGKIATVSSREGDTAFLSANDRSRWCTVAALVEDGTYAIDRQISIRTDRGRRPWYTIDLVRHRGADGELHYYSSKPPLLATIVAGVYGVFHWLTGMTLTSQPIYVGRWVLALVNLPMYGLFLFAMIRVIERVGTGTWDRRFLVITACFGTLLFPFVWTLNNHLPAAMATAVALWVIVAAAERMQEPATASASASGTDVPWAWWALGGAAAAFAVANELPALSMFACWTALVGWLRFRAIVPFLFGALLVAAAFFATNWMAHQSWRPPYAHRGDGAMLATMELPEELLADENRFSLGERILSELVTAGVADLAGPLEVEPSNEAGRWRITGEEGRQWALRVDSAAATEAARPEGRAGASGADVVKATLAVWDDWYDYPGSYWQADRLQGIDRGERSRAVYLFHMTLGHHGVFSLTPLWLLVPVGWWMGMRRGPIDLRLLSLAIAASSLVCGLFYLARPEIDRNYGGVSIAFRWFLWFAPLWLFACIRPVERLSGSTAGRGAAWVLLAAGLFSVATSLATPWQHPWIYRFWAFLGWIAD